MSVATVLPGVIRRRAGPRRGSCPIGTNAARLLARETGADVRELALERGVLGLEEGVGHAGLLEHRERESGDVRRECGDA